MKGTARNERKRRYENSAYYYVAAILLLVALIVVFPIGYTVYISLTNMNLYHWFDFEFIGIGNYIRAFSQANSEFLSSLGLTILWTIANMVLITLVSLVLAVLLNVKGFKGRNVYKTLLMFPWAVPSYVSILLWRIGIFNGEFGLLGDIARALGSDSFYILQSYWGAFFASLLVNVWLSYPFTMTMMDGALQSIDQSLYEAARLDGAGFWRTTFNVSLPEIVPIVAPSLLMTAFMQFKQFDVVYLLTLQKGAQTGAGLQTIITYAHTTAFESNNYGLSSAISTIIFMLIALLFSRFAYREAKEGRN